MPGSKPPSSRNRSARTSMQPPGTRNTSRTASCCSWSSSPGSTSGAGTPVLSAARPTLEQTLAGRPTRRAWARRRRRWSGSASSTMARTASGVERDVVVAEAVERRPLDDLEHLVGGGAEAGVAVEPPDVGRRQDRGDAAVGSSVLAGVDDEHRQGRVVLVAAGRSASPRTTSPGSWVTTTATTGGACGRFGRDIERRRRRRRCLGHRPRSSEASGRQTCQDPRMPYVTSVPARLLAIVCTCAYGCKRPFDPPWRWPRCRRSAPRELLRRISPSWRKDAFYVSIGLGCDRLSEGPGPATGAAQAGFRPGRGRQVPAADAHQGVRGPGEGRRGAPRGRRDPFRRRCSTSSRSACPSRPEEVAKQARTAAKDARTQVRGLVGRGAAEQPSSRAPFAPSIVPRSTSACTPPVGSPLRPGASASAFRQNR